MSEKMQEIGKKLAVHLGERCLRSSLSWELRWKNYDVGAPREHVFVSLFINLAVPKKSPKFSILYQSVGHCTFFHFLKIILLRQF